MTTREAAALLGCSPQHIRTLIAQGRISAKRLPTADGRYYWVIKKSSLLTYDATVSTRGWVRGKSRKSRSKKGRS